MPRRKAGVGQRWWIEELQAWRVIVARKYDKRQEHMLYGVRDGRCPEYPLGPVSADRARGRFFRARSLRRRDKRIRPAYLISRLPPQNAQQLPSRVKGDASPVLASCGSQGQGERWYVAAS